MQLASTKYLIANSSIPLVHKITLTPASINFLHLSLVISISLWRIFSKFSGLSIKTATPGGSLNLPSCISKQAILAFLTVRGIPWAPLILWIA